MFRSRISMCVCQDSNSMQTLDCISLRESRNNLLSFQENKLYSHGCEKQKKTRSF